MSDPLGICLVGSTGLIGSRLIEQAVGRPEFALTAISRREVLLPAGARMVLRVADPVDWAEVIVAAQAQVLVCALGTTWRKAGKDEAAFRAIDYELVLECARAAKAAGTGHVIVVSSVGADTASRSFYLRVKGELEVALGKLGLQRLDIVRPGLLRGPRGETRVAERLAMLASPLADLLLHGDRRKYRSIRADMVARAILALAQEKAGGRFIHDYDAMRRAIRRHGG